MSTPKDKTDLEVSYFSKQGINNLKVYKKVLDAYQEGKDRAQALDNNLPIFVDTNVLLSYYEVSFSAREKIMQFVDKYKNRIVLSAQVQYEFIKNREKIIHSFQTAVTEQLPKDFQSNVINKLQHFQNDNKKKLEDYSTIQEELDKLEKSLKKLNEKIGKEIEDKRGIANKLVLEDKFLDLIAKLEIVEPIEQDTIGKVKAEYDKLKKDYSPEKENTAESYSMNVFPGCAEKGKDDPTGDYIIFHEMMGYSKNKNTDIIFLTNDTTKGDWIRKDGTQHLHYLENFYENTSQMIYILNSERVLTNIFENTSFESLVPAKTRFNIFASYVPKLSLIKTNELLVFINSYPPFNVLPQQEILPETLVEELYLNNYIYLSDIESELESDTMMIEFGSTFFKGNRSEFLQDWLKMVNGNYKNIQDIDASRFIDVREDVKKLIDRISKGSA